MFFRYFHMTGSPFKGWPVSMAFYLKAEANMAVLLCADCPVKVPC